MELKKGTGTILVVDDEAMVKDLARDILKRYGYTVITAGGGAEAVSVYRERGPEIAAVLLDILMPDVDGKEAFRVIREINPEAKIVVSSGYNQERDARALLELGAKGFVQKPYRIAELVKVVGDVLEQN
ncbi:MAG: response regulator [Nitrospiraceae bacterium]|nr:response regulator [Nitrospiraceae bacterium]